MQWWYLRINFPLNAPMKRENTDFCYGSALYIYNLTSIQSPTSDFVYDILNLLIIILLY